ncbi:MAG: hypothetical protein GQ574_20760 [Crocinitomix sp.]|nr:hypothetical protein [Crocinitomix sp.]
MQYFKQLSILFIVLIAAACSGDSEPDEVAIDPFISVTTIIDSTYPDLDATAVDIMTKLQICTILDTVLTMPPCSAEIYRVFQYRSDKDMKDGFLVEMVPGLYGSPVHQIVIIENYFGKYRIVNQYLGYLIEMRSTPEGYHDLLIGYSDPDIGLVAIRHEWQGEKYDVVDVEEINNHYVKPEMKDSINAIFLPAFAGGH